MKRILLSSLVILILLIPFSSCSKKKNRKVEPEITFSISPSDSTTDDIPDDKREIFYGLLTPVEISAIFDRLGATYTPEILNDNNRGNDYLSSSKASLNLGVYGVDLSYLKMFNLNAEMIKYMVAVRSLSSKLGIPIDYLTEPIEKLENNMNDSDSILNLRKHGIQKN